MYTTHSNTLLSFWSPQMRISEMDLRVSTNRLLLASVTVWFLHSKLWRYLLREKTCFVHGYHASHSVILCIWLNKSRKKCNVLNKNEYYSSICIIEHLPTLDISSLVNLHVHVFVYHRHVLCYAKKCDELSHAKSLPCLHVDYIGIYFA